MGEWGIFEHWWMYYVLPVLLKCNVAMDISEYSPLQDRGILVIPTVPDPPPKLQTDASTLEFFGERAFSLLSIAGLSGFCQVFSQICYYKKLKTFPVLN